MCVCVCGGGGGGGDKRLTQCRLCGAHGQLDAEFGHTGMEGRGRGAETDSRDLRFRAPVDMVSSAPRQRPASALSSTPSQGSRLAVQSGTMVTPRPKAMEMDTMKRMRRVMGTEVITCGATTAGISGARSVWLRCILVPNCAGADVAIVQ